MMKRLWAMTLAAIAFGIVPADAGGGAEDPLAAYQWHARVLLVIAADQHDPKLARQRSVFANMAAGARDRDLKLVEAIGPTPAARALRQRFDIDDQGFRAILIGKDGGDKLTSAEPLDADQLFPLIDAMPMRQEEMRRKS